MDIYIYYQVESRHAHALQAEVVALQATLHANTGVATSLKRRPEEQDGRHTWMEVYLDVPAGFDAVLAAAITNSTIPAFVVGHRHTEFFLDYSPCA